MKKLRIVFMGTPDFAVGILDSILKTPHEVVGVITAADKPAGRGQKLNYSAVKEFALEKRLPLLQPTNLKDEEFLQKLAELRADIQVVVAFRMLPKSVWAMPELGTFNLHASLLPEYRGAAPINWAIINGESTTGVTTFFIDEKIDTGAIILSKETQIQEQETAGELHDRLKELGSQTVVETLSIIAKGEVKTQLQPEKDLKPAPKLNRENCKIDWNAPGKSIQDLVRGLSPYPAAWCYFKDSEKEVAVKIYLTFFEAIPHDLNVGEMLIGKKDIKVAVQNGFIHIHSLQYPGKKKMTTAELLNGLQFIDKTMAC